MKKEFFYNFIKNLIKEKNKESEMKLFHLGTQYYFKDFFLTISFHVFMKFCLRLV